MLNEFFLVSGWAFWIVIGAVFILDIILLSNDNEAEGWAVTATVLVLIAAILFSNAFVGVRISMLIAAFAAYMVLGVLWSIKKWYSYVVDTKKNLRKQYDDNWSSGGSGKPKDKTFEAYAADKQPTAAYNKQRLVGWMALWPFSLSWWILTWPRRAFVWIYDRLSTLYDRISAHIWSSI